MAQRLHNKEILADEFDIHSKRRALSNPRIILYILIVRVSILACPNMRGDLLSACLLLATTLPAHAAFSEFFFAGNNGTSALKTCPESLFECAPPSVCSFDDRTQKYYCCEPGKTDAVCWGPNSGCDGGDSTTPSGGQQACSSGANTFCCLKSRLASVQMAR